MSGTAAFDAEIVRRDMDAADRNAAHLRRLEGRRFDLDGMSRAQALALRDSMRAAEIAAVGGRT